jgi:DNA-binding response OmpR family regulator
MWVVLGCGEMGNVHFGGCSILIVEDEALIALELREVFEREGAHVFAATQLPHALALARHPDLTVAVLDYRIGDESSVAICRQLDERDIPFLFYSGYDDMREAWPTAVIVNKPAPSHSILDAVRALLDRRKREGAALPAEAGHHLRAPSAGVSDEQARPH